MSSCKHKFAETSMKFNATHMDKFIQSDLNQALNLKYRLQSAIASNRTNYLSQGVKFQQNLDIDAREEENCVVIELD